MKSRGAVGWTQYRELDVNALVTPQVPALPQISTQGGGPARSRPATRHASPRTPVSSNATQPMPADLQIAAGLLLAGSPAERRRRELNLNAVPVSPVTGREQAVPLRYEAELREVNDVERAFPGSAHRMGRSSHGATSSVSRKHRVRGRTRSPRPHPRSPRSGTLPSARSPTRALRRGQSLKSLQTELLLRQFCKVDTFGVEEDEIFDDVVVGWQAEAGSASGAFAGKVADHVQSSGVCASLPPPGAPMTTLRPVLLRSILESSDHPSALAASIALNCLRRLAQHVPAYSSLLELVADILDDATFQDATFTGRLNEMRGRVRSLLGSMHAKHHPQHSAATGAGAGAGADADADADVSGRNGDGNGDGEKGGNSVPFAARGPAPGAVASGSEEEVPRGLSPEDRGEGEGTFLTGFEGDGSGAGAGPAVETPRKPWAPTRRVLHAESSGSLTRDVARLAAALAKTKQDLAALQRGEAPRLFRGDAESDLESVRSDLDRLSAPGQHEALSLPLLRELYERAGEAQQRDFRRWCLQRADPDDVAAHLASAPPEAVVELALPRLRHSGAQLAQLLIRADGLSQRAALAACHDQVAAALRDDKSLCVKVARNAPIVLQHMIELGADAVHDFIRRRPLLLHRIVTEQVSRDPHWLAELCTNADYFQSVVEGNTALLSGALRRKRAMLIDYVKDKDSFPSLCKLAEATSDVMAAMIAETPPVFDSLYKNHTAVVVGKVRDSDEVVGGICRDRDADCATWALTSLRERNPEQGLTGAAAAEVLGAFDLAVVPPKASVAVQTQPPKAPAGFDLDKRATLGDLPLHVMVAGKAGGKKGKKAKVVKPRPLTPDELAERLATLVSAKIHTDRSDGEMGRPLEHLTDYVGSQLQTLFEGKEYEKQLAALCASLGGAPDEAAAGREMRASLGASPDAPYNNNRGIVHVELLGALCGKADPLEWCRAFFLADHGSEPPRLSLEEAVELMDRGDLVQRCGSRPDLLAAWAERHRNEEGLLSAPALVAELLCSFDEEAKKEEASLIQLFHEVDDNGDGVISLEEFTAMVQRLDKSVEPRIIRRLFDLARGGGSNKTIPPSRFVTIMRLRSS